MSNDSSSDFGTSWASNELSDRLTIATYATTHFVRRQSRIGETRALTLCPDLSPVTRVLLERGPHLNKALLPAHLTVFSLVDKQQKEIHEARQSGSFNARDGICLRATAVIG
jgi:hypothetical protein